MLSLSTSPPGVPPYNAFFHTMHQLSLTQCTSSLSSIGQVIVDAIVKQRPEFAERLEPMVINMMDHETLEIASWKLAVKLGRTGAPPRKERWQSPRRKWP